MAEQAGKVGAVYAMTGNAVTSTLVPIGTGNASTTVFYLQETIIDCEAIAPTASGFLLAGDWTSSGATAQTLTADATDEKEGTYCIKNNVTTVAGAQTCLCLFTFDAAQDWHDRAYVLFWIRCELAQSGFTSARFEVVDSSANRSYWNLTFAAGAWTRQALLLGTPDGNSGTACDLTDITIIQLSFVAIGTTTFYQELDFIGLTPQAIDKTIVVTVATVTQAIGTYLHTVSGKLTFNSAPANAAAIAATYDCYAISQVAGFFSWAIDQVATPLDSTDFGDSGHKTFIVGLDEWSASAERHWHTDTDMHAWVGVIKIIKFFSDASADPRLRWEGWAVVSGLHPGVAVDTLINESLDFQGTGVLTYEST